MLTPNFAGSAAAITASYQKILKQLPGNVQLVAVSKTHPAEAVQILYDAGQRVFAENKVQELLEKQSHLPSDIQWHLIGHLQRNKVKYIAPFIHTIESVDSPKLLAEISKEAQKNSRSIRCLLQIKIAAEDSKFGLTAQEAADIYTDYLSGNYKNVNIDGIMGMATFTEDLAQIEREFKTLKEIFDRLSRMQPLQTLSMGMSADFDLAIACGSNSVRVGSAIFGERTYK